MKITLYNTNGHDMYLHPTPHGLMLCKSEDISQVCPALLQKAKDAGACINQQHGDRLLLDNGTILHSMNSLPVLDCPQSVPLIGEMIVLCDQQGFNPPQQWLVNAVSLVVLKKGKGPEFMGYPQSGMKPAKFQVTYRDGSARTFKQLVQSLPEDVSVVTTEIKAHQPAA